MVLTLICYSNIVYSTNNVIWQIIDWPPHMVLNEGSLAKVNGPIVDVLNMLQKKLVNYKHTNEEMLWSRSWRDIKTGKNICNILALKNDLRKKYTEFSIPLIVSMQNQIIIKKSTLKKLKVDNKNSIMLKEVLSKKSISGVLEKSRSYTKELDNILKKYESSSNINRLTNRAKRFLQMVKSGRIEYFIEYPGVVKDLIKSDSSLHSDYKFLRIEEVSPVNYVHLACSKTTWGISLIKKVNNILRKERRKKYYKDIIVRSLSELNSKDEEDKIYKKFINSN